jgi:hypothetical protein
VGGGVALVKLEGSGVRETGREPQALKEILGHATLAMTIR